MKITFLQKDSKEVLQEEPVKDKSHLGDDDTEGSRTTSPDQRPEKPPYLVRNWIPLLTVCMALLVLISSATVMHNAIPIANNLGRTIITDPISITLIAFMGGATVIIQSVVGTYQFIHYKLSSRPITSYVNWSVVYLALMSMACAVSFASMRNGLHRDYIGFSLVYFSIADAVYLFMSALTFALLWKD